MFLAFVYIHSLLAFFQAAPGSGSIEKMSTQLTVSAVVVAAMQWFKNSKYFPWLTTETAKLNRAVAVILAGAAAVGVHTQFSGGTLTITGLSVMGILGLAWEWLKSFVYQQLIFQTAVKGNGNGTGK